jgi:glycine betaine/proline transport system substrate-binding protein
VAKIRTEFTDPFPLKKDCPGFFIRIITQQEDPKMKNKSIIKSLAALALALIFTWSLAGCGGGITTAAVKTRPVIRLIEADWSSNIIGTEIASQVLTGQLGYKTEKIQTSVTAGWAAIDRGDADAAVECWLPGRLPEIKPFLDKGNMELGTQIFPGGAGWFMPRFVSQGDTARGIKAVAPDLKSILDLKTSWKTFENPEKPGLGELVGGSPGWTDDPLDRSMIRAYALPLWRSNQSESVICARMLAADKKGQPLLMYLWWPHWLFAQVDMVMLSEPDPWYEGAFVDDSKDYKAGHPPFDVHTVVATRLKQTAPDAYALIKNMVLGEKTANALMLKVDVEKQNVNSVAADWIKQHQAVIDKWLGR